MEDLKELRKESLANLYSQLSVAQEPKDIIALSNAISKVETADAKDVELSIGTYDLKLRERDLDERFKIEELRSDTTLKAGKQNTKTEIIKGLFGAGAAIGGGLLTTKMVSWILEQEKTGTITSRAYNVVAKSFPKF